MGLLREMKVPIRTAPEPKLTFAEYRDPVPEPEVLQAYVTAPSLEKEVPAPEPEVEHATNTKELTINRDKSGLVSNVTGYNAAGEQVTFTFARDGKRNLQKIKVG